MSSLYLQKIRLFRYFSVVLAATDTFRHHWSCLRRPKINFYPLTQGVFFFFFFGKYINLNKIKQNLTHLYES